ncbi:MAG: tRNA preQ1(34) S-adenosylmethionine ribosyltransferase-isomerase QueA [Deltaproteobacteria bacterium]|nr:tRNA preQ1(34) S-adenosylmethionine ribosyltransferase-isomerase QueA [Deltaproteobacteria bacterium]
MKLADYEYTLPEDLIAQQPAPERDQARLLVWNRVARSLRHAHVRDILGFLAPGTLLVFNQTKVVPARLHGRKPSGGAVELLLLERVDETSNVFAAMGRASRGLRVGDAVEFGGGLRATIRNKREDGLVEVEFEGGDAIENTIERIGVRPLPPYIHRPRDDDEAIRERDRERYQTVFAREPGAVAAPTAGLHFTPELLDAIRARGFETAFVTLHVGAGTFAPVKVDDIDRHVMHEEAFSISEGAARSINAAKDAGRRILAVGTTVCRALESAATRSGDVTPGAGRTRLFVKPGYRFRVVDDLMTNFHLPKSTLLMLVSALVGREQLLDLYRIAVEERYRFFSYGDAMLILADDRA